MTPALTFSVTASISTLRPAAAGDMPTMFCRYIGRKMCRPTIGPQPKVLATMAIRAFPVRQDRERDQRLGRGQQPHHEARADDQRDREQREDRGPRSTDSGRRPC